jgi:hypothetical protein
VKVCAAWPCTYSPNIELPIIEQREVNLPAHRGNIGLVEQQNLAAFKRKAPPKRGR